MNKVEKDIHLTIKIEDRFLFPELKEVLPEQTSINALAEDHKIISDLIISIKNNLENNEIYLCNSYKVQSEIIKLFDIIQRNIHKKENILFYEVSGISYKTLEIIYENMKKEISGTVLLESS